MKDKNLKIRFLIIYIPLFKTSKNPKQTREAKHINTTNMFVGSASDTTNNFQTGPIAQSGRATGF